MAAPIADSVVYQAAMNLYLARNNVKTEPEGQHCLHPEGKRGETYRDWEMRYCADLAWKMAQAVVDRHP